jgi:trk system potassium uptake protein TrkA
MNIVIVGDGKVGSTLVKQLSKEGHDIVIIDNNLSVIENSMNMYDVMGIDGNGANLLIQKQAGVDKSDLFIAATSSDELNMLSCMMAKKLGAKHRVGRVRNPEYSDQLGFLKEELGMNMVINPEQTTALEISRILRFPTAIKIETFSNGRAELIEIKVPEGSRLVGQPLYKLSSMCDVKVLICVVQRGSQVIIPTGEFVVQAGDRISITASPHQIHTFIKRMGLLKDKVKMVMIVGGSRLGHYLAKMLLEVGMEVKIIEVKEEVCRQLSEDLPKAIIIHGDGTNHELLIEEGIDNTDAFISLTGIDEENIILSMYAKKKEVKKVVTKINKISFSKLLTDDMVDSIVSPKYLTANQIVSYVRGLQNSMGSSVQTLHRLVDNQVEALEFAVKVKDHFIGKSLKDLRLKENLLIAVIIRNHKTIIPAGNDTLEVGDRVIIVTTIPYLRDLKDIVLQ